MQDRDGVGCGNQGTGDPMTSDVEQDVGLRGQHVPLRTTADLGIIAVDPGAFLDGRKKRCMHVDSVGAVCTYIVCVYRPVPPPPPPPPFFFMKSAQGNRFYNLTLTSLGVPAD